VIVCDFCNKTKECFQREIERKEYDVCRDCWEPVAAKLKGKGRDRRDRDIVLLPQPEPPETPKEPRPFPERPPKIWGNSGDSRCTPV
jgi:hypothetical protein